MKRNVQIMTSFFDGLKKAEASPKVQSPQIWQTLISNVMPGLGQITFTIVRPGLDPMGGTVYIWGSNNELVVSEQVSGDETTKTMTITNSKLVFETGVYKLGYGPNQVNTDEDAVAATVMINYGVVTRMRPSRLFGFNNTANYITSRYWLAPMVLQLNDCYVYAVKGSVPLDYSFAIDNNIKTLGEDDPYQGACLLKGYPNGSFTRGEWYTVCLNVYSWKRIIAAYSFQF